MKHNQSHFQNILGVVLAGGRSRRMNGEDKALAAFHGKPLFQHALERLAPQVNTLLLSTNTDMSAHNAPSTHIEFLALADSRPGYEGPLAGLLTAFEYAEEAGTYDAVVTIPVDTPFFPYDFVAQLKKHTSHDIVLAGSGNRVHPTCGLWRMQIASHLQTFLAHSKMRSMMRFVELRSWCVHKFDALQETQPDPFLNINTNKDLAEARKWPLM